MRGIIGALLILSVLVASCGSGNREDDDGAAAPPAAEAQLPPPAEPAQAPEPTVAPAGRVVPVGPIAEGAVADAVTGLVAVGLRDPFRLALVDGATGGTAREVPLPGHLRHLQLAAPGGPVLVPAESADALLRVALPGGEVGAPVPVGRFPHDATATAAGRVLVANEFGGTVSVVENDRKVHVFDDATQPGGLAAVGEQAAMVDVRENTLTVYDVPSRRRTAELPAGQGPTHVVADRQGRLVVADTRGDALIVFTLTPAPRELARLELPGTPYGITYDDALDRLWVTLTGRNEVVGFDMAAESPREVARFPTIRQPNTVAVNSMTGRLFVASPTEGALQLIDP